MNRLLVASAAMLLCACTPKYLAPQSGSIAVVKFTAGQGMLNGFAYYRDNRECQNPKFIGAFHQPSGVILRSLSEGNATIETQVPAGRFAGLQMQAVQSGYMVGAQCTVTVEFDPIPDLTYEVVFNSGSGRCWAEMYRGTGAGTRQRESSARMAEMQCGMVP